MSTVEKGIPMPPKPDSYNGKHRWHEMQVGDSILLGASSPDAARSMVYKASQKLKRKFEWRQTADGFRAWRTK